MGIAITKKHLQRSLPLQPWNTYYVHLAVCRIDRYSTLLYPPPPSLTPSQSLSFSRPPTHATTPVRTPQPTSNPHAHVHTHTHTQIHVHSTRRRRRPLLLHTLYPHPHTPPHAHTSPLTTILLSHSSHLQHLNTLNNSPSPSPSPSLAPSAVPSDIVRATIPPQRAYPTDLSNLLVLRSAVSCYAKQKHSSTATKEAVPPALLLSDSLSLQILTHSPLPSAGFDISLPSPDPASESAHSSVQLPSIAPCLSLPTSSPEQCLALVMYR